MKKVGLSCGVNLSAGLRKHLGDPKDRITKTKGWTQAKKVRLSDLGNYQEGTRLLILDIFPM